MKNRSEKGFTLTEVLVAMAIFSFGILAIFSMQILSTTVNVKSRGMTEGVIVAQNKVEELATLTYLHADLVAGNHGPDVTDPRYTVNWVVTDDQPVTDTKAVQVTVSWNYKGITQDFDIGMYRTNGE